MAKRTYVARTQPGLARVAKQELERPFGDRPAFATILPLTAAGVPVFGPYIFIEFDRDLDYWQPINGVRGIQRLLPTGLPDPLPLPEAFVQDLKTRMSEGAFDRAAARDLVHRYVPGEAVAVVSGAFGGFEGTFSRKNKGFINVSLLLFNRKCEVPIPAHQVKPASAETGSRSSAAAMGSLIPTKSIS